MYQLYVNAKGGHLMDLIHEFQEELVDLDEKKTQQLFENSVYIQNAFPRRSDSQLVVVQDGFIVAVEGLTTRKLIWVN